MLTIQPDDHGWAEKSVAEWLRPGQAIPGTAWPAATTDNAPGRTQAPQHVIADAAGFDLCPDPLRSSSAAELIQILRQFHIWAGEPPLRAIARASGGAVAISTISMTLNGSKLPRLDILLAIIAGCGGNDDHQRAFATAWRQLRLAAAPVITGSESPPGP
jgi:hypothetical protein